MLCALLRSACWSCISSCAKTASCLGVSEGKLAWVYSVGSLGSVACGCMIGVCGIIGIIAGAGLVCCCILWMACNVDAQITARAEQSNRIQEHLGKNQTKEATTTDARHPQLPHLHITGRHLVASTRPQLQHKKEIRGHSVPAAKQNQHHGHIWAVPYGRQPVQCPQTSRAKGLESGM